MMCFYCSRIFKVKHIYISFQIICTLNEFFNKLCLVLLASTECIKLFTLQYLKFMYVLYL